jgi:hypothetical protein
MYSIQYILLSQICDSPNLEDQVPVFISPRNRVARLYPQTLGLIALDSIIICNYHLWVSYELHHKIQNPLIIRRANPCTWEHLSRYEELRCRTIYLIFCTSGRLKMEPLANNTGVWHIPSAVWTPASFRPHSHFLNPQTVQRNVPWMHARAN